MKIWLLVTLLLAAICHIQGDSKILREVNIESDNAFRKETFSLKNENSDTEEIVIEGTYIQTIRSKDNPKFSYRVKTIYVADKNGNRVIYKINREPTYVSAYAPVPAHAFTAPPPLGLNPSTLKGLAG